MKGIVYALGLIVVSSQAFAGITKEVWTCKNGSKKAEANHLKVTVDRIAGSVSGTIYDGVVSYRDLAVERDSKRKEVSDKLYALLAEHDGRDSSSFSIELVPTVDFESLENSKKGKGKAVVFEYGSIDGLGETRNVELLSCDVSVEKN